jgi:hypothetical protein
MIWFVLTILTVVNARGADNTVIHEGERAHFEGVLMTPTNYRECSACIRKLDVIKDEYKSAVNSGGFQLRDIAIGVVVGFGLAHAL